MEARSITSEPSDTAEQPWRHPGVVEQMAARHGIARATAEALFDDVALFLSMAAAAPVTMVPSGSIDDAWHTFILHTADYTAYCEARFGVFLHHAPEHPASPETAAADVARHAEVGRKSRTFAASALGAERPAGWPHHRARQLRTELSSPVVQDVVLTLLDDMEARRHFLESPVGWLGDRRGAIDDETYLGIYDFFGGGLRYLRGWPGVTDRLRAAAIARIIDDAVLPTGGEAPSLEPTSGDGQKIGKG